MLRSREITDHLRSRILADLNSGRLDPHDRLPSIRSLADELGADHRTVGRAYRSLEEEGLVEIRPRSGVFVSPQDHLGQEGTLLAETAEWLAGIAAGAWTRRIELPRLPRLLQRCLANGSIRCVLVESVADVRAMWSRELAEDFGLEIEAITVSPGYDSLPPDEEKRLGEALEGADFVVTSVYHTHAVEAVTGARGVPLAVLRYAPRWLEETRRGLDESPSTLMIVLDPDGNERRFEPMGLGDRLRLVSVEEWDGTAPEGVKVYCSLPAAERLGEGAPPVLGLPGPSLSPDSAHAVCEMMVRANLEREDGGCVID